KETTEEGPKGIMGMVKGIMEEGLSKKNSYT
ncbi:FMRFamide neuropeptide, partial [Bacillus cereus]